MSKLRYPFVLQVAYRLILLYGCLVYLLMATTQNIKIMSALIMLSEAKASRRILDSINETGHYAKIFDKRGFNGWSSNRNSESRSKNDNISQSHYDKNRKFLAKVFIIWSVVLVLLLLNVVGML